MTSDLLPAGRETTDGYFSCREINTERERKRDSCYLQINFKKVLATDNPFNVQIDVSIVLRL